MAGYDANVAALQSVINRFAPIGGYSKVKVDGGFGTQTRQGAYDALRVVQRGTCANEGCPSDEDQSTAESLILKWDGLPAAARGMQMFLGQVADNMGLAHVPAPVPPSTFPNAGTLPINPFAPGAGASLLQSWNAMPLWQRVAIGVLAGVGLLWARKRIQERHAPHGKKGRR